MWVSYSISRLTICINCPFSAYRYAFPFYNSARYLSITKLFGVNFTFLVFRFINRIVLSLAVTLWSYLFIKNFLWWMSFLAQRILFCHGVETPFFLHYQFYLVLLLCSITTHTSRDLSLPPPMKNAITKWGSYIEKFIFFTGKITAMKCHESFCFFILLIYRGSEGENSIWEIFID